MKYLAFALTLGAPLACAAAQADPLATPSMESPITANATPTTFDAGPLGNIYVTGAVSGLALWQNNPEPGDHHTLVDLSNGQVFVQKTDGWLQFYVQAGEYSLPSLGAEYFKSGSLTNATFGVLPQAYLKIAPTDNFSIEAGKLPTLIGAEYTFTVENMNIERGLLWNQEPAVSRGVQLNYTAGALALSASWNDGFYSDRFNWFSGSATWTIDTVNTLALVGGGNVGKTGYGTFATPYAQNNGDIFNLIYTYNSAPWLVNPYIQYTDVPANASLGIPHDASTWGLGLLATYTVTPNFSLSGRAEYEKASGNIASGAPNLLYGPGSNAWSVTITPTYQYKVFFARADISYVAAGSITPKSALGPLFDSKSQGRLMLETGIVF
jgi:hypothetical protein